MAFFWLHPVPTVDSVVPAAVAVSIFFVILGIHLQWGPRRAIACARGLKVGAAVGTRWVSSQINHPDAQVQTCGSQSFLIQDITFRHIRV
jgi:hypothetical protein